MAISLETLSESHLKQTYEWVNQPELMYWMNYPNQVTYEQHTTWFERIQTQHPFAILSDDKHIGNTCIKNIDPLAKHAEVWIYLGDTSTRQQGFGKKALGLLLEEAFNKQALERVYLYFNHKNIPARRLYEQAGFSQEGCFRQHIFFEGEYYDAIYMGLLKSEWNKNHRN